MHDFHVSVIEMEHDQEAKRLEISQRIFIDDMEQALSRYDAENEYSPSTVEDFTTLNPLIEKYILERFKIWVDEKPVELVYLGSKVEEDILLCFIEVPKVKKMEALKVENKVLFELFADQINLVHIKTEDGNKSLKLSVRQPWDEWSED